MNLEEFVTWRKRTFELQGTFLCLFHPGFFSGRKEGSEEYLGLPAGVGQWWWWGPSDIFGNFTIKIVDYVIIIDKLERFPYIFSLGGTICVYSYLRKASLSV